MPWLPRTGFGPDATWLDGRDTDSCGVFSAPWRNEILSRSSALKRQKVKTVSAGTEALPSNNCRHFCQKRRHLLAHEDTYLADSERGSTRTGSVRQVGRRGRAERRSRLQSRWSSFGGGLQQGDKRRSAGSKERRRNSSAEAQELMICKRPAG